jgi:phage baseplate assembly protein W
MGVKTALKNDEYRQYGKSTDKYSDFNHTFFPHPNTGQISRKVNVDSVELALRNLILTNKYERLRNPEFGTNIRRYLFEPFHGGIEAEMKEDIRDAVSTWEPRVRLHDIRITASPDDNSIFISIEFSVFTDEQTRNLDLVLYRVR